LLSGFSDRTNRITSEMVVRAAESLDLRPSLRARLWFGWAGRRVPLLAGAAVVLLASAFTVGTSAFLYRSFADGFPDPRAAVDTPVDRDRFGLAPSTDRQLPAGASLTILVGAYPMNTPQFQADVRSMTEWLEASGFRVYYSEIDSGSERWQRVLAGAYTDARTARVDADRLRHASPSLNAQVVAVEMAGRAMASSAARPGLVVRRAGIDP
jgi:hypothetical protein